MIKALYTSATGMRSHQFLLDVISNNLANVNTTGFKRVQVNFQDLLYDKHVPAGAETAQGLEAPVGIQVGSGSRVVSTTKVFSQGVPQNTGRQLDVSVQGDGFFQVSHPDGSTVYTRDGSFQLSSSGQLVTSEGLQISPAITIPSATVAIHIGTDGSVSTQDSTGAVTSAGQLTLSTFANPAGLESMGRNLFRQTSASGTAITGTAGQNGIGEITQGFLESSNVEVVTEMVNIITAQRAYETSSKSIKAADDMLKTTNRLVN